MAKKCIVCGKKLGLLSCDVDGIMCDSCYGELGGYKVVSLECEVVHEEFEKCYTEIEERIEGKLDLPEITKEDLKLYFYNALDSKSKRNTGMSIEEAIKQREENKQKELHRKQIEMEHVAYANSFNEFYEYDVVTIINEDHGRVDKTKMMRILAEHTKNGWRLHTMYSNELGKNALKVLGFGVNSTACEDVLIFERRIRELD